MVISLDNKEKNARLSLRQTEILAKLSEIVDVICVDHPEKCVRIFVSYCVYNFLPAAYRSRNFTPSTAATC